LFIGEAPLLTGDPAAVLFSSALVLASLVLLFALVVVEAVLLAVEAAIVDTAVEEAVTFDDTPPFSEDVRPHETAADSIVSIARQETIFFIIILL
jgi:hypothetical protein